jgi:hypothetical protein
MHPIHHQLRAGGVRLYCALVGSFEDQRDAERDYILLPIIAVISFEERATLVLILAQALFERVLVASLNLIS